MTTSLLRVIAALFALTFVLAACASDEGAQWTFDPAAAVSPPAVPTAAPTEPADTSEPTEPTEPTEPGEARVIRLLADGNLQFTDPAGQKLADIPVVPGETILFEIDNTAGFGHNFYIGTDDELRVPGATTDIGIPDWSTGVETLEWVVPEDITGLKFGCTVPGHYALMQGTFSVGEAPAAAEEATAEPATGEPAAESGEARIIRMLADGALQFTDTTGQKLTDIPVVPGETILFEINNTAGFPHNFYIGTDDDLRLPGATTDVGIPDWSTGTESVEWVVPEDITDLKFGCTFPGHYTLMQGTFSLGEAPAAAEEPAAEEPAAEEEPALEEPAGEAATVEEEMTDEVMAGDTASETPTEGEEPAVEGEESATAGTAVSADARVIAIEADAALRFTQDGEQIRDIPVTPGEKIVFRVDNTAGFAHNLYIGTDSELAISGGTTDVGIPDWNTGVQHLDWIVPDDITDLKFGCTFPGHYTLMQGTFSISE